MSGGHSVAFGPDGELYISVLVSREQREAYLIHIDSASGEMLGRVDRIFAHELAVSPDGSLLLGQLGFEETPEESGTRGSAVVLFRPRN